MAVEAVKVNLESLERFRESLAADLTGNGTGPVRAAIKRWGRFYRTSMQERFVSESNGFGDWPALEPSTIAGRRAGRRVQGKKGAKKQTRGGAVRRMQKQIAKREKQRGSAQLRLHFAKTDEAYDRAAKQIATHTAIIRKYTEKIAEYSSMDNISVLRDTGQLFGALAPEFDGAPGALEENIPFGIRVGYGGAAIHQDPARKNNHATIAEIASYHQIGAGRLKKREIIVKPPADCVTMMREEMDFAVGKMLKETGNGR